MADDEATSAESEDAAPIAATSAPAGAKGADETIEPSRARRGAARRIAEAKAIVPHLYLDAEADLGSLSAWQDRPDAPRATLRDVVVRTVALALREVPALNGSYRDGRLERHSRVNVGFAAAGRDVTLYPTIHDADHKPIEEIAAEAAGLADRARRGEITSPELAGATFAITALEGAGATGVAPVVIPPQAGALGVGPPTAAPVVREGAVVAGEIAALTLACDGRAVIEREAADFLAAVRRIICSPGLPEL